MALVTVVDSHFPSPLVLLSLAIFLPDFLADFLQVAQSFLVVGFKSQCFLDLAKALVEVVMSNWERVLDWRGRILGRCRSWHCVYRNCAQL